MNACWKFLSPPSDRPNEEEEEAMFTLVLKFFARFTSILLTKPESRNTTALNTNQIEFQLSERMIVEQVWMAHYNSQRGWQGSSTLFGIPEWRKCRAWRPPPLKRMHNALAGGEREGRKGYE